MHKDSELFFLIIKQIHWDLCHSGLYNTVSEVRKNYYIPSCFSFVKKVLKTCVICRRFNSRTIKLNQSFYRELRLAPKEIPYRNCYIDFQGPFYVKNNNVK